MPFAKIDFDTFANKNKGKENKEKKRKKLKYNTHSIAYNRIVDEECVTLSGMRNEKRDTDKSHEEKEV